jgi:pimeloyl-ACP methyl ester carboxylesterase
MAMWQWRQQVQFLAPHFNLYVPDLIFFGESTTRSKERTEIFQAESVGKLLEKIGVRKCHVAGTSYGGIVAYNLAKMLGEEKIEKVVIASSGVNMTKNHNVALLKRAGMDKIEDLMLPSTTQHLRKLMTLCVARRIPFLPNFFLKDFLNVSSTITLLNCDIRLKWLITCWQNLTLIFYKNNFFLLDFITEQFNSILSVL